MDSEGDYGKLCNKVDCLNKIIIIIRGENE
jgi:hypothetical protein